MAAAEDWLRQQGIEKLLMVRPDNPGPRVLRTLGYDEAQER